MKILKMWNRLIRCINSLAPDKTEINNVMFWYIFQRKRCKRFIEGVEAGKSWNFAYKDSKKKQNYGTPKN